MSETAAGDKLRVSPQVAQIVGKGVPRERQLSAARGEYPLSERDAVAVAFFLCHSGDHEIRDAALRMIRKLTAAQLLVVLEDPATPLQLIHFLAQVRLDDAVLIRAILAHAATGEPTLLYLATRATPPILHLLLEQPDRLCSCNGLVAAVRSNPHADEETKTLFATLLDAEAPPLGLAEPSSGADLPLETEPDAESGLEEGEPSAQDEVNLSKYQQALEMGVSEKIKMALTGDKEFRTIFLKDPNKLVHGAVLKNPRVTEGEVLALAKNKASSEELIRLILLNKEWLKNPQIKAALVTHPKTPLPHALRYLTALQEKDLKILAKSKGVSQVLVNAARRMLTEKDKKGK